MLKFNQSLEYNLRFLTAISSYIDMELTILKEQSLLHPTIDRQGLSMLLLKFKDPRSRLILQL